MGWVCSDLRSWSIAEGWDTIEGSWGGRSVEGEEGEVGGVAKGAGLSASVGSSVELVVGLQVVVGVGGTPTLR